MILPVALKGRQAGSSGYFGHDSETINRKRSAWVPGTIVSVTTVAINVRLALTVASVCCKT